MKEERERGDGVGETMRSRGRSEERVETERE